MIHFLNAIGWGILAYLLTYILFGVMTYIIFRKVEKITSQAARSVGAVAGIAAFLITL